MAQHSKFIVWWHSFAGPQRFLFDTDAERAAWVLRTRDDVRFTLHAEGDATGPWQIVVVV